MAFGAGFTSFPARRCFPFLAVGHSPSYRQRKRSLGSARDDDSGRTFFQRTLYTIQRISIPTLSFRAQREIFLALRRSLLLSMCKKDPSTSLGMTMRIALCSRYFHAATPKSASSRHIDPSLWPAPSLRRAKKGS